MRHTIKICLGTTFALMVMFVIFSCEKAIIPDEGSDNQDGNLRVSVYQIEKTPFASFTRATEATTNICNRLSFAIYDEGGSRLKQINQTSGQTDFGHAAFQLEAGTYQLVVVGHSASGNPTMTNPAKIQFTNATGYTDTFLCYDEVTIAEEAVDYEVSLNRITSLCRFVLTDESIPSDVKTMQFYYTGGSGAFNAATGLGSVASKQTVTVDVTSGQSQFDLYTFLHDLSDNIALKVSALDASGNVLYEHTFDVPMEQNHITWLSGAFFNGSGSSSTAITGVTVNTAWAGETHLTF